MLVVNLFLFVYHLCLQGAPKQKLFDFLIFFCMGLSNSEFSFRCLLHGTQTVKFVLDFPFEKQNVHKILHARASFSIKRERKIHEPPLFSRQQKKKNKVSIPNTYFYYSFISVRGFFFVCYKKLFKHKQFSCQQEWFGCFKCRVYFNIKFKTSRNQFDIFS